MSGQYRGYKHPRTRTNASLRVLAVGLVITFITSVASAERQHIVRSGQSLEVIAKRYKLKASELAAANGLTENEELHGGQVLTVPPDGIVYVARGQTLGGIAHEHGLGANELAEINKLTPTATLRVGQRLVLPGYKPSKSQSAAEKRWGVPKQRGVVTLYRIWSRETQRVRLVDSRGRTKPAALRTMRELLRPRESRKRKTPNARLLSLLAEVSDHYGGRTLHVVSGFRMPGGLTRDTSRHVAGEAIDFRIPGVPLTELRDYCHHFDHVGVGYYPRTQFVHLDVRRQSARWTDWSLPGQPAILQEPTNLDDDGASSPAPKSEAEIPEGPPAADDGQPPIDDDRTPLPAAPIKRR
jgi:uncharacterized protein YcbK (DUF882 family)/LysM repeat protein